MFHLVDPQEMRFDFNRPIRFVDLEGGADLVADPSVVQATYLQALENHMNTLRTGLRKYHVDHRIAQVDQHFEQVLTSYLLSTSARKSKGGGGRK